MFAWFLSALLTYLAPHLSPPPLMAIVLGLSVAPTLVLAGCRVLRGVVTALFFGPVGLHVLKSAARWRPLRLRQAVDALLIVDFYAVARHDRRLRPGQRIGDDPDLVLVLAECVRLQCTGWMAWGPLAALFVLAVACVLHSRIATAGRGRYTVSGALSAVVAAWALPLPIGGHAVAVKLTRRAPGLPV